MLTPEQWDMLKNQAKTFSDSGLFDRHEKSGAIKTSPQQVVTIMMFGLGLKLDPTVALMNISIMRGKMSMETNFMVGLATRVGYVKPIMEESDDERAVVEFRRNDWPDGPQRLSYTMDQAKRMGLPSRNQQYSSQPSVMLMHRARAAAARLVAPDMLAGVYAEAELDTGEPLNPMTVAGDLPVTRQQINNQTTHQPVDDEFDESPLSGEEQEYLQSALRPATEIAQPQAAPAQAAPTQNTQPLSDEEFRAVAAYIATQSQVPGQGYPIVEQRQKNQEQFRILLQKEFGETSANLRSWSPRSLRTILNRSSQ